MGLGVGITEGILVGEGVGTTVGEGVVGEGVLSGVGEFVGDGVGTQVVHSKDTSASTLPEAKPVSKIAHISEPTGGVYPHLPVLSSIVA